ncbi:Cytochrome b561 domain-containing protein [Fusarium acuminatum]|uniref:Cytochrome b561 domain-containing protein n=1 Tax=Fusarium acuminatum TaxID=5515 RepID=A0ABZ2WR16_9HYPO
MKYLARTSIASALAFAVLVLPVLSSTQPSSGSSDYAIAKRGNGENKTGTTGTIHGVIMSIVFLLGFPIGSLLMPLVGKWLIHASWQIIVFIGMCVGFGVGKIAADRSGDWISDSHVVLGTFVCVLMVAQPFLGWFHHRNYVKHQRRTKVSYGHIWLGRTLMVIGIINGGTGLKLSGASSGPIVAYSVIGAIVFSAYTGGVVLKEVRLRGKRMDDQSAMEL